MKEWEYERFVREVDLTLYDKEMSILEFLDRAGLSLTSSQYDFLKSKNKKKPGESHTNHQVSFLRFRPQKILSEFYSMPYSAILSPMFITLRSSVRAMRMESAVDSGRHLVTGRPFTRQSVK